VGARLEPSSHWTFAAQYLDGDTAVGEDSLESPQFTMRFRAEYALASFEWARDRLTVRYDDFHTHQLTGFFGAPSNQNGHGWTFAWTREFGEHWKLLAEWLHVASIFPPREGIGLPPAQTQSQLQLAARYQFQLSW
jgi:hypothetical protein